MTPAAATSATVAPQAPGGSRSAVPASSRAGNCHAAVLAGCLLGVTALIADAASGQARLGLVGLSVMALALAATLRQAVWARVGRPLRTSRLAARAGTAASLFVTSFLALVGVLERTGPQATENVVFAAGVALMSVVLLVVLPLALVTFGWCVLQDRRLSRCMRSLPLTLLLAVTASAVAVTVTDGSQELWLEAAGVAAAGVTLAGCSAGLSRTASARPGRCAAAAPPGAGWRLPRTG